MFDNLSDDDRFSTQLEGKKLKNRGAALDSQKLDITKDSPLVGEDGVEVEGQEYFVEREFGEAENSVEREERLKRERLEAVRAQQTNVEYQQQQQIGGRLINNPNLRTDGISKNILEAKGKNDPTLEMEQKQGMDKQEKLDMKNETQVKMVKAEIQENGAQNLSSDTKQMAEALPKDQKVALERSIPARDLPDVRDKTQILDR